MSAPSPASRTEWLRPCPRAAPVIRATLPDTRPGRPAAAGPSGVTTPPRPWPGRDPVGVAGDVEGLPPAFEHRLEHAAGRHAVPGPQGARTRQVEGLLGQAVTAIDQCGTGHRRCAPVQTSSRTARPVRRPARSSARSSRRTPARCSRVLASARSPVQRQQGPGDRVRGDQRHLPPRIGPATRPPRPRPDRPPGRARRPARRGATAGPCRSSVRASTTDTIRRRRWPPGAGRDPGGQHHLLTAGRGPRRARRWSASRPVSIVTPEPPALGEQPLAEGGQPLASGPAGRVDAGRPRPARSARATRTRCPRAASTRAHSRPAGPAPTTRTSAGGPRRPRRSRARWSRSRCRGSPTQLTSGLRLSRTRQAWLHRMQGRTRSDSPAPHQADQAGLGDLRPGHLHQVGHPVVQGGLGHRRVDDAALQHHGGPAGRRLAHRPAQVEVEAGRGVGVGTVGGGRVRTAPDHHDEVDRARPGRRPGRRRVRG